MTEWGSLSLVDQGEGDKDGKALNLPGVKKGDMSSRHWKPEVRVMSIQFSPTGKYHRSRSLVSENLLFDKKP